MEAWKEIKRFNGKYEVSSYGRIRNSETKYILKQRYSKKGYLIANFYQNGKKITCTTHRLVLENFNPIDGMNKLQVNHIDEIKDNNRLDNLEWTTSKENINHGNHNKKIGLYRQNNSGNSKKSIICLTTGKVFISISEAARHYNIKSKSNISHCAKGTANYCGTLEDGTPLVWMYYDEYLKEKEVV